MEPCLRSLLTQDYPDYEVIFVTCDEKDEAVPIIRALMRDTESPRKPRCRLIQAGPASTCGQKNRNLLVGMDRIAPDSSVIAFADSAHQAATDWLRLLVYPIARGETDITTGYHHIIPEDNRGTDIRPHRHRARHVPAAGNPDPDPAMGVEIQP